MKKGDLCFFYHSNIGKEIVGIVEVIKESYIDKTDKSGRFVAVTVKFKNKLSKPITLENIKNNKDLSHLALIKQSRLSVMPIDYKSLCFFYHSNIGKEIVGIVEVIKESYIDKTDKSGRFVAVTVKFKNKLSKPITLENIKKNKDLSHLALIKQSRLSVMPIDYKSWKIINNMSKV